MILTHTQVWAIFLAVACVIAAFGFWLALTSKPRADKDRQMP